MKRKGGVSMAVLTKEQKKAEKRLKIEQEMHSIVMADRRKILLDNIKRRTRPEFKEGDKIRLQEWIGMQKLKERDRAMYRVFEGTVLQVTRSGYYVEGVAVTGVLVKDFINRAHIINGAVSVSKIN